MRGWALAALVLMVGARLAVAFPPAPHHEIYGVVRDEYGTPLPAGEARILLETPSGVRLDGGVAGALGPAVNYRLKVPMDAGLTADLYQKKALLKSAPFRMYVVVGGVTNVPIEMKGDFARLGQPGQSTRIDLTLGTDANGDGIPDAWELAYLSSTGSGSELGELQAGSDLGGTGRTLLDEYRLGAYPFNPGSTLAVRVSGMTEEGPTLEFETMTGRSYTLLGSSDLRRWEVVNFRLPGEGAGGAVHSFLWAPSIQTVQVRPVAGPEGTAPQFFRLVLQ